MATDMQRDQHQHRKPALDEPDREPDVNEMAFRIVQAATAEEPPEERKPVQAGRRAAEHGHTRRLATRAVASRSARGRGGATNTEDDRKPPPNGASECL